MLCSTDKTSTQGCSDEWSFPVKQILFLVSFLMVAKPPKPGLTFPLPQQVECNEQNPILSNRWLSLLPPQTFLHLDRIGHFISFIQSTNTYRVPAIVLGSEDTVLNMDAKSLGYGFRGAYSLVGKHPLKKYNFLNTKCKAQLFKSIYLGDLT